MHIETIRTATAIVNRVPPRVLYIVLVSPQLINPLLLYSLKIEPIPSTVELEVCGHVSVLLACSGNNLHCALVSVLPGFSRPSARTWKALKLKSPEIPML
jgi:hypothetical protein